MRMGQTFGKGNVPNVRAVGNKLFGNIINLMGNMLSADVVMNGENLIVTLTHSEYGSDCPAGTELEFEPYQP